MCHRSHTNVGVDVSTGSGEGGGVSPSTGAPPTGDTSATGEGVAEESIVVDIAGAGVVELVLVLPSSTGIPEDSDSQT